MTHFSVLRSAGIGILISLFAASSFHVLNILLDNYSAWALSISVATFLSLLFMVCSNTLKKGGISLLVCYTATNLIALLLAPSIATLAIFNVLWLWIARSVIWHKHVISSLADLTLSIGSLLIAIAVGTHTQSAFMSFWSFFLAQALIIPALSFCRQQLLGTNASEKHQTSYSSVEPAGDQTHFDQARRNAERALQILRRQSSQ